MCLVEARVTALHTYDGGMYIRAAADLKARPRRRAFTSSNHLSTQASRFLRQTGIAPSKSSSRSHRGRRQTQYERRTWHRVRCKGTLVPDACFPALWISSKLDDQALSP